MKIEHCLNLAVRKSARLVTRVYEEHLSKVGLKVGQFSILRAVHFMGEASHRELQAILLVDQTTLSRNLQPLVRDGFLELSRNPDDQRVRIIRLSVLGESLYRDALPLWEEAQKEMKRKVGVEEADNLLNLSATLIRALGRG